MPSNITKAETGFKYNRIPQVFSEQEMIRYCNSLRQQFSILTKNWSDELNHEWVLRSYLAVC
jgi:hypothetical protein